jgi:formamidopyrimidine-DNA glycosylase
MPELAEVEFYRKRWQAAAGRAAIVAVRTHAQAKVFRGADAAAIARALRRKRMTHSAARGKQMLFRFGAENWLGIHLGMSGELRVEPAGFAPGRHDHLVLFTRAHALVFSDPRTFGRIRFSRGREAPAWWSAIAPSLLSSAFTPDALAAFLKRHSRAPVKSVLLMQERFPGIGNWMADEILWRAAIHPRQSAGSLRPSEIRALWGETRRVCRLALALIAGPGRRLDGEPDQVPIPRGWLLSHRWQAGGTCPRTGVRLARATIGGRTACWSPARQKFHR